MHTSTDDLKKRNVLWSILFLARQKIPDDCQTVGEPGDVWMTTDTVQVRVMNGWTNWIVNDGSCSHPYLPECKLAWRPQTNCLAYGKSRSGITQWRMRWALLTPDILCDIFSAVLGEDDARHAAARVRELLTTSGGRELIAYSDITEAGIAALMYPILSRFTPFFQDNTPATPLQSASTVASSSSSTSVHCQYPPLHTELNSISSQPPAGRTLEETIQEAVSLLSNPTLVSAPVPPGPATPSDETPPTPVNPSQILRTIPSQLPGPHGPEVLSTSQRPLCTQGDTSLFPATTTPATPLVNALLQVIDDLRVRVAALEGQISLVQPQQDTPVAPASTLDHSSKGVDANMAGPSSPSSAIPASSRPACPNRDHRGVQASISQDAHASSQCTVLAQTTSPTPQPSAEEVQNAERSLWSWLRQQWRGYA